MDYSLLDRLHSHLIYKPITPPVACTLTDFRLRLSLILSLVLSLAAALPFTRCSLAAFISFGAEVRTCLICVGTRSSVLLLDDCCGDKSHGADKVGTDSSRESKDETSVVVLCDSICPIIK